MNMSFRRCNPNSRSWLRGNMGAESWICDFGYSRGNTRLWMSIGANRCRSQWNNKEDFVYADWRMYGTADIFTRAPNGSLIPHWYAR